MKIDTFQVVLDNFISKNYKIKWCPFRRQINFILYRSIQLYLPYKYVTNKKKEQKVEYCNSSHSKSVMR